jgi:WD40 repeat protein
MDALWLTDSRRVLTVTGEGEVCLWEIPETTSADQGPPPCRVLGRAGAPDTKNNGSRFVVHDGEVSILTTVFQGTSTNILGWQRIDLAAEKPLGPCEILSTTPRNLIASGLHVGPGGRWALRAEPYIKGLPALLKMRTGGKPPEQIILPETAIYLDGTAFSPNGRWVAFGRREGIVRLYDLAAGQGDLQAVAASGVTIATRTSECTGLAFSHDGKWLAVTGRGAFAQLVALDGSAAPVQLRVTARSSYGVSFSPDDRWLAIGNEEGVVSVWPIEGIGTARPLEFRGLPTSVAETAFSLDGRILYAFGHTGTCRRWEFNSNHTGVLPLSNLGSEGRTDSLAASSDHRWIFAAADTNGWLKEPRGIQVFDTTQRLAKREIPGHVDPCGVAVSPDGKWFASVGRDATVHVWKLPELTAALAAGVALPEPLVLVEKNTRKTFHRRLAFHPKGRLYCTSGDGELFEWDLTASEPAKTFRSHLMHTIRYLLPDVAVSPDGRWLAVGRHGYDKEPQPGTTQYGNLVLLIDASDPDNLISRHELRAHHREYGRLVFTADSRWLAAGAQNEPIDIWDLQAADIPGSVRRSPMVVSDLLGLDFAPASAGLGSCLALGASDGRLHLWDWQRGAASIRTIETPNPIYGTLFLSDGRMVTSGLHTRVSVWETAPAKLIELAKQTAGRELTPMERERFGR